MLLISLLMLRRFATFLFELSGFRGILPVSNNTKRGVDHAILKNKTTALNNGYMTKEPGCVKHGKPPHMVIF